MLEKVVAELLVEKRKQASEIKDFVFEHSDNLSLFLTLRHTFFSQKYKDQSTKIVKHLSMDIMADDQDFQKLKAIAGKSVYIYPRLHNSLPLLINEIYLKHSSSSKLRLQQIKKLAKTLFDENFFDENVYLAIKSSATKPKFLHIGLKFWEMLGLQTLARESKTEVKTEILNALVSESFLRVFVRGVSFQKGVLFEAAKEVKTALIKMLQQVEIATE